MSTPGSNLGSLPQIFALCTYPDDAAPVVVAWGMRLPDGSAVAVEAHQSPSIVALCSSAERAAILFNAEVVELVGDVDPVARPP